MRTLLRALAVVAVGLAVLGPPAIFAEENAMTDHSMHMGAGDQSPSSKAYAAANEAMHRDMAVPFTGNADVDFVKSMIPHHQGAIDMAKVELRYGSDPAIRKLAEEVIAAQEAEIAMMEKWLKARGE